MDKPVSRSCYIILCIVIFIVMLIFNCLTPMVSDDYAHYYGTNDIHAETLNAILQNMLSFRTEVNGRVVSHFCIYVFLALPRIIFRVFNALFSVGITVVISKFFIKQNNIKNLFIVLTCIFALWIFTPSFGEVYLWLSGSVNYSWGLLLDLLLIYPFFCAYTASTCDLFETNKTFKRFLYILLAIVVGAYSENGATATICVIALLGLLIWIKEKKLPVYLFILFICACIGYSFLMTAPATLHTRTGGDILEHIWYCRVLTKKYMTILWIVYIILLVIAIIEKVDIKIIFFTVILIIASVLSIAVFVFAIYLPPRSFMIAVSFTILANSCLLAEVWKEKLSKAMIIIPISVSIVFCVSFINGFKDIVLLNRLQHEREYIIEQSIEKEEFDVLLPRFVTETDYSACPEEELSQDRQYWYNDLIARYYGLNSVTCMTENQDE